MKNKELDVDLQKMNNILRHRLRNLCAGVKMTIERISNKTATVFPAIPASCDIIIQEFDNLENFTTRMDLLFETLPIYQEKSLFDIIYGVRSHFIKKYPFSNINLEGPEVDLNFKYGSWILLALQELVDNAGDDIDVNENLFVKWENNDEGFMFSIINHGEISKNIPINPPQPFNTIKSKHDGIGLAIVTRIITACNGELIINNNNNKVCVNIKIPKKGLI